MRAVPKFFLVVGVLSAFFVTGGIATLFSTKNRENATAGIARFYSRLMARVLGVRVRILDAEKVTSGNYLVISNHHSYLDILPLFQLLPASFLTSIEVKDHWFLGPICKYGGCYFVERRQRTAVAREIDGLRDHLQRGNNLVIFPEGTTGDGTQLLPFKATLLETAIRAQTHVLPVCIKYQSLNGMPVDWSNRDKLYWYGEMTFFPHVFALLKQRTIEVEVRVLDPIPVGGRDRKVLANEAYAAISQHFVSLPPKMT